MPYARTRLGRLFYEERGESKRKDQPAIVLLHALLFDGGMWRGQLDALAQLGRVIVVDAPGHGHSEAARNFTLEEHADAVTDVLDELGIDRAVFIGLSWGGMCSMRVALRHPRRVVALGLVDTSAEGESPKTIRRARAFLAFFRYFGIPYRLFETQMAPFMYGRRALREKPELLAETYRRMMGFDREGVVWAFRAVVERSNVLSRVHEIHVPTLIVCGRNDRTTPLRRSKNLAAAIEGATFVVLEDIGHMTALEEPETITNLLVPFVREQIG